MVSFNSLYIKPRSEIYTFVTTSSHFASFSMPAALLAHIYFLSAVIGRGGEQITRLQAESGCKIQMAPDSAGLPERICSLSGTRDAVARAKELIMNIVHQRGRTEGLGGMDLGPGLGQNNYQGMFKLFCNS